MKRDKRCLDYSKANKETEKLLRNLERHQTKTLLRDRIRFLRLLKSGECPSQAKAGHQIGLGLRGSEKLWKKYCSEGIEGLLVYPYKGTSAKLTKEQAFQLQQELSKDETQSLEQARDYIAEQFGVLYTTRAVGYMFARLGIKKKTGRPVHHHKDVQGEKQFKKKIS